MSDFGQPPGTPPPSWGGTPAPGGPPGTPPPSFGGPPAGGQTPPPSFGGPPGGQTPPPAAAAPAKSKTPGILLAVFGALTLFGSCLPFGAAAYLMDEAESDRSQASYYEYPGYGSTPDPFLADLYRRDAEEEQQMSIGSACCGSMCCLSSIGMLIGAAVMLSRARKT